MSLESLEQEISELRSEVASLQEQVNIKVSKADLISEINVSAGRVLIDGESGKIHLNSETIKFDKGTLETTQVNIINLKEEK